MSDTFDHEGDAWAYLEWEDTPTHWRLSPVRRAQPKVCKHCNTNQLWWRETEKGWRLFNNKGEMHTCSLMVTV